MVEIGPGLAALTEPVGERLDELTVIELDRDLAARLQTHPFLGPKLTIYQQDAMTMNFGELSEKWVSRCAYSATCRITSPRRSCSTSLAILMPLPTCTSCCKRGG